MTNTINNVPRELLPCPFCGSEAGRATKKATWNLSRHRVACTNSGCGAHYGYWHPNEWNNRALLSAPSPADHVEDVRAMVDAQSPAGADGLEVVAYRVSLPGEPELGTWLDEAAENEPQMCLHEPLCRLSDAQAIIDGLRGEVDKLMTTFVRVADHLNIDCEKAKSAPGKPSDVFIAAIDQQTQRIGELEGLLLEAAEEIRDLSVAADKMYGGRTLLGLRDDSDSSVEFADRIDAALSASKDSA